ncbi:MAG: InlB B-repeat-containing protein [Clostridia bacterium]|nr:InlB B-repeat-containing protein [Clostridia bacterium]
MENMMQLHFRVDGEVYQTVTVEKGELVMPISAPEKEGHRFVRWDNLPEKSTAGKEVTVDAVYEACTYVATFVLDDTVLEERTLAYGAPVAEPALPDMEDKTFLGWENLPATMPAGDIKVEGKTEPLTFSYTMMVDDEVFATYQFAAGADMTGLPIPEKEGHTFSGWNKNYKKMPHSNLTVRGTLTPHPHSVVFEIDDEMKFVRDLHYGDAIRPIGIPSRPNHSFVGWENVPEVVPDEDLHFHGHFEINSHTLRFMLEDHLIYEAVHEAGSPIKAPEVEPREGYMFSGWRGLPKKMPDCDYTAEGRYYVKKYKLVFQVDGEEYDVQTVAFGAPVTPPEAPQKEGLTFSGWDNVPDTMPADDVVVVGSFKQ